MNKNKQIKNLLLYLGLPILVILALLFFLGGNSSNMMTYSDVLYLFEEQKVEEFSVDAGTGILTMKLEEGTKVPSLETEKNNQLQSIFGNGDSSSRNNIVEYKLASVDLFYSDVKEYIDQYNSDKPESDKMVFDIQRAADRNIFLEMLPTLILFVVFGIVWFVLMKKMGAGLGGKEMTFGKAKFKNSNKKKKKTTFADVAGADEEKEELEEIVQFLKTPEKYNKLGAKIPKGVLLVGPPGTGKTLLARAVAGEAGVPFFSISGSDFVEMFVGVGASRVRDLFDTAKKNSPCIVFIDEIDAVGRQRGAGLGGGNDEREQTLNQLLVEMDGFGANEGVIVIAATNRPDVLDPAILRPGRFDRQVVVGYPDINGREAILKVHAREKPLAPDVNLRTIASSTAGFTGADLENVLNEAALLAARKNKRAITMEEIEEATIKVVVGTEKKSKVMSEKEKKLTAYHEAGHAICTQYCETQDPVHQISIIPRGRAGGYTMSLPTEDKTYSSRNEMLEDIVVLLGGRVAEALIMGDISTGASNDIERATNTAKSMVTKYGMSEALGPVCYGSGNNEVFIGRDMGQVKDYSEETAAKIDQEILRIINNGYKACEKLLKDHMDQLHSVAQYLIKNEKMSGDEFRAMLNGTFEEKAPLPEGEY